MFELLWLTPAVPLASFFVLALFGRRISRTAVAVIGTGSIGVSALIALLDVWSFIFQPPAGRAYTQTLWTWMDVGGFRAGISFYLDALSLVMLVVVSFVSFLIHLYSTEFMAGDEGYARFFAYMNLFVASMIMLVLGDNLLLLYLGWEGVGLCSYLLIGFWYTDPANGLAARKAFIVTRVGDTSMILGLFLLFHSLGTLNIQELMNRASAQWPAGSGLAVAAGLLLLGGAVGKSAQLPLQTWLPDAMAGPTPTSALIHAATMVTAGVYLIARMHVIYSLAPAAQHAVAFVGAATLLVAGFSALTQSDIKRVLAYSTVSQIGYMFLALGVGAWSAAMFHFMTHAFFKALLFLAAGAVINALHHEHNIFRMGGLRHELPLVFWTFLIAGCSLAGLPLVTAGFYSKGLIIWEAWAGPAGSPILWTASVAGVFLTSLYIFRLIFIVFFGTPVQHAHGRPGAAMGIPFVVLAFLSVVGGFVNLPPFLGDHTVFADFLATALPQAVAAPTGFSEAGSEAVVTVVFVAGLLLAFYFFLRRRSLAEAAVATPFGQALHRFWFSDWGMDWLYDRIFVRPTVWIARINRADFVDLVFSGIAEASVALHRGLSRTQTGRVRWYAAGVAAGAVLIMAIVLIL